MQHIELEKQSETIENIAHAATRFAMLHVQAKNDITFDLERITKLDGDTGPYLLYARVRILSILEKSESNITYHDIALSSDDTALIQHMQYYPRIIERAGKERTPHHITQYLLKLCALFSGWYERNPINNAKDVQTVETRRAIAEQAGNILSDALFLLNIPTVEKM